MNLKEKQMAHMVLEEVELRKIIKEWIVKHKRATDFLGTSDLKQIGLNFTTGSYNQAHVEVSKIEK